MMSARARTTAGSRQRGRPRAIPEVFCPRPLPNNPLHNRTRTRSFGLSPFCVVHDLCSVSWRFASMFQFFVRDRLSFVSPHFWLDLFCTQADPGKPRTTIARKALVSSRKTHDFVGLFSTIHQKSISAPRRRHGGATAAPQRRVATRLLCNCQDTRILTSQWPPCTCESCCRVSSLLSISVFFCVRHSTRTQFLHAPAITDHRIHSI